MKKEPLDGQNRRELYRIIYPISIRPVLEIHDIEYDVIDISEKGIRILNNSYRAFPIESIVKGKINFSDGKSLNFAGNILRSSKNNTIISLTGNIPFMRICIEQRYIRDKYHDWFQK